MKKTNPLKDRFHEVKLRSPITVDQFLAAVIMAEIAVEADIRELVCDAYRSPDVLSDGGPMCLKKDGQFVFFASRKNGVNQPEHIVVIFSAPAGVHGDTQIAACYVLLNSLACFLRGVDAVETAIRQPQKCWNRLIRRELDTFEAVRGKLRK